MPFITPIALGYVAGYVPIKIRQVTQVFKRFGVPLAQRVGAGVVVKDVNQLPGVAICVLVIQQGVVRIVVVGVPRTDLVPVGRQLLVVGLTRVGGDNRFRRFRN